MTLPARRPASLLERPQRLGVLPTLSFWNDHEPQRLLLPLVVAITAPLAPLVYYLQLVLALPFWVQLVPMVLVPVAIMGLVERKIRRELVRRALAPQPVAEVDEASPLDPWSVLVPAWGGSFVAFVLAMVLGVRGPSVLLLFSAGAIAGLALVPGRKPKRALPPAPAREPLPGPAREPRE